MCAALIGEPGIGKTRLLAEVADRAAAEGDLIVGAGPHDSGAFIPYHPIRTVMLSLLTTDGPGLWRKLEEIAEVFPLVSAGMREVLEPSGLRGTEGRSRAGAVAAALAYALREAMKSMHRERVVLMIDDLHRCDGLSAQVLNELAQHTGESSVLLLVASQQARKEDLPPDTEMLTLRALTMSEARASMAGYAALPPSAPESDERAFVPLYLEQLRALGLAIDGVPHTLPRRLADAVMQRMQRLSLPARRMLQAACVLGNRCGRDQLMSLAELDDTSGLDLLKSSQLLAEQDGQIEVVHPFIRDLVEASIPAEARKTLHARALGAAADADAPLEVRAHHAYGAGETLSALMLLERMGDLASERGDPSSAVLAFRRCLDLVRRELLELGETSLEDAMASFSRKLGNALGRGGDLTGAEGVLREALEFCRPGSIARAHVLLGLGRVVANRKRLRDAYRLLGEALEIAIQRDDDATQAAVHVTVGELRRSESNLVGAVGAFSAALQRLSHMNADALAVARAAVELAVTLAQGSDPQAAGESLLRAQELAREADAPHLEARAAAAMAELHETLGDRGRAETHLRHACEAALRAGDASGFARYDALLARAEAALTDPPRADA
jgi:tetratricopeptide (TPR) repeat protein